MGEAKRRRAIAERGTQVGAHHVVIIEWLPADERQTGTELANLIRAWNKCGVIHCRCKSSAEVLAALYDTLENLKITGNVPIIHIEAHGVAPVDEENDGIAGPNENGGVENLHWKQLAPLLREINLHSRFSLLLLGAACHGINALDALHMATHSAPFTALIGFEGTVHPRRLFESMSALYWQLLIDNHGNLPLAIEAANRELHRDAGEELRLTTCLSFFIAVVTRYLMIELEPSYRAKENERLASMMRSLGKPITHSGMDQLFRDEARKRLREIVRTFFAYDALPENRLRFGVDVDRIYREQEQSHAQVKKGAWR